jgi:predicted PurR-regulated permease PerM
MPLLPVPVFDRGRVISLFAIIFYVVLAALGLMLLYALRGLIPPFLVALAIALTLAPEIDRLERRGWRRGAAIMVLYALFLIVLIATLIVLVPLVSSQLGEVAKNLIPTSLLHTTNINGTTDAWLNKWHVPYMIRPPIKEQVQHIPQSLSTYLANLSTLLPAWAGNMLWVVLIPVMAFYLLFDYHRIVGKLLLLIRREQRMDTMRLVNEVVAVFGNYVRGVVIVMLMDIVVIYVVLRILRIHFPETIAVLAGILYAVPYLGAIISTVLIGLVAYATRGLVIALVTTAVMILIHQVVFDQIVAPRIIGKQVGLHPLLAIFAMLVGGTLLGIGGTLLAIPLAAAGQVVLVHLFPNLGAPSAEKLSELYAMRLEDVLEKEKREEEAAQEEAAKRRAKKKQAIPLSGLQEAAAAVAGPSKREQTEAIAEASSGLPASSDSQE